MQIDTIFILAAGNDPQWHGPNPKQMVLIAGEPLLIRTLRQLKEREREATVVTHKPEIIEAVPNYFTPAERRSIFHTMLSTERLWEGNVLMLEGDVFYPDEHLDIVFNYDGATPTCFDSFGHLFRVEDYDKAASAYKFMISTIEHGGYSNRLWREKCFGKVEIESMTDFDIVPYYESFLEKNPWAREGKVVYAHGCFDLFHVGHLRYLEYAKKLGDILAVGVNSDRWAKSYGANPIIPFKQRIEIIRSLRCVNYAIERNGPLNLDTVNRYGISVNALGTGSKEGQIAGVKNVVLDRTEGISSTIIKERIRSK